MSISKVGPTPYQENTAYDGDSLLDDYETGTGLFVSAFDTGTNPLLADSDGDLFDDDVEIARMEDTRMKYGGVKRGGH